MKLHFVWASRARAELRRTDRETAMRILNALTKYADTGEGDVKALEGKFSGTHRLRVGAWRIRFRRVDSGIQRSCGRESWAGVLVNFSDESVTG